MYAANNNPTEAIADADCISVRSIITTCAEKYMDCVRAALITESHSRQSPMFQDGRTTR
jgi:hypothetical protein